MPSNDTLNWQEIMEIGAEALGSSMGKAIINKIYSSERRNENEQLIRQAIEEICERIKKIVDQAFLEEYIADCNSIAKRLPAYNETNDPEILHSIFDEGANLIERLKRFDTIESITTINCMSTLHLTAIKALSEHSNEFSGYKETLKRYGKDYADWSESHSERLIELTKASVGEAYIWSNSFIIEPPRDRNNHNSYPTLKYHFHFIDNWDFSPLKVHHYFSNQIQLTDFSWWTVGGTFNRDYELTEQGLHAPVIQNGYPEARKAMTEMREAFLQERLDFANTMKETILSSCETWRSF
ncbi:hypothetical protein [Bacillus toyonensis]|uniref:hypothetical protein n=1 Tax=Bacillus toyonensis TaxID=155322 RepID=UPI000BF02CC8|nr:hypothetical protein [Bacillus toyonensis]PEO25778.1 hypothetical protein CN589_23120 [Bacillus toyonensis]PFY03789.1 hypothetical protein COL45_08880 [Bacillus toyonensis]PHB85866.1 hypothetical protein COE93_01385 [Bacillus toyonensis]